MIQDDQLFSRDGHLTMLTLDRFEQGELTTRGCDSVIDHLEACPVCSGRVVRMQIDDAVPLLPPASLLARVEAPARIRARALGFGIGLAAAAALLVLAWPKPQQLDLRANAEGSAWASSPYTTTAEFDSSDDGGQPLRVQAFVGDSTRPLPSTGASVPRSESLRITVDPYGAGYLAVMVASSGDDRADEDEGTGGLEALHPTVLLPVTAVDGAATPEVRLPPEADALGSTEEHLVVVFCTEPFDTDNLDLEQPAIEGCSAVELWVTRNADFAAADA